MSPDGPAFEAIEETARGRTGRRPEFPDATFIDLLAGALAELVRLKDVKDREGESADYRSNKDRAWDEARRVLALLSR